MSGMSFSRRHRHVPVRRSAILTALALMLGAALVPIATSSPALAAGTVTVTINGQGRVTAPGGMDCTNNTGTCSVYYPDNVTQVCDPDLKPPCHNEYDPQIVTFTASATQPGFAFTRWMGCPSVNGATCTLTVDGDANPVACSVTWRRRRSR